MSGLDEKALKKHTSRIALIINKFVDQEPFVLVPPASSEGKGWVKELEQFGIKPGNWSRNFKMKSIVLWQPRAGKGRDPYNPDATDIVYRSNLSSGAKRDEFYRRLLMWRGNIGYHGTIGNSPEIYIPARLLFKTKEFGGGGGSGGGASKTALAEAGACIALAWLLDTGRDLSITDFATQAKANQLIKQLDKFVDLGKRDTDQHMAKILEFLLIDEQWLRTSVLTAKKLKTELNLSTGGPYTFHRDSKFMNSIYKTAGALIKTAIKKIVSVSGEKTDLSISGDKWNPGDIWIADTASGFSAAKDLGDIASLNTEILNAFNQTNIMGISLKKIGKGAAAAYDEYNMSQSDSRFGGFNFKNIVDVVPTKLMDSKDMYIEGSYTQPKPGGSSTKDLKLQIRTFDVNSNIQTELKGGAAAAGKAGFGIVNYTMNKLAPSDPLLTYPTINKWTDTEKEDAIIKYYNTLFTGKNVTRKDIQETLKTKKDDKSNLFSTWGKPQQDDYYASKIEALQICSIIKEGSKSKPELADDMLSIIMAYAMSLGVQDVFRASAYAKVS